MTKDTTETNSDIIGNYAVECRRALEDSVVESAVAMWDMGHSMVTVTMAISVAMLASEKAFSQDRQVALDRGELVAKRVADAIKAIVASGL